PAGRFAGSASTGTGCGAWPTRRRAESWRRPGTTAWPSSGTSAPSRPRRASLFRWLPPTWTPPGATSPARTPAGPCRRPSPWLERLIRDLDDRSFRVRERAFNELEKLGGQAEAVLRKALAGQPSLEARRRMDTLVAKLDGQEVPPERLRALRTLRVLEELNTPD